MSHASKEIGDIAEDWVREELKKYGVDLTYSDDERADFKYKKKYIEVKCSCLSLKNGFKDSKSTRTIGKFTFKNKEQLPFLKKKDAWVVFVIHWERQHILLGCIKARELLDKQSVSIFQLVKKDLIVFYDLADILKKVDK